MDTKYITHTETNKLIRKQLSCMFPLEKFSVRKNGNATIVTYNNEELPAKKVEEVLRDFNGQGFDGSIDLKYSRRVWLDKNNNVVGKIIEGTEDSRGYVPPVNDRQPDSAILAQFGADYVFVKNNV